MSIYNFMRDNSSQPLYMQLKQAIINDINLGLFGNMQKLPSRRELARELGLSTTTVNNAYQALVDEGYAMTIDRSGFYIKSGAKENEAFDDIIWEKDKNYLYNFTYNDCDLTNIKQADLKLLSKDIFELNPEYLLRHSNKRGEPEFRLALCRYLGSHKQLECGLSEIFTGAGVQYLLTIITMVLGMDKTYGFENPTDYKIYVWLKNLGVNIKLVNISGDTEFSCDELDRLGIDVMIVMPENQLPTGTCMSEKLRRELAHWCSRKTANKYVIEYATDGNLNYQGYREKTIYSLSSGKNTIYIDSFYPTISNNTKAAFMVLPKGNIDLVIKKLEMYSPLITIAEQLIYSRLINSGAMTKLIKHNNKTMLKKRNLLKNCLKSSEIGDRLTITNDETGMNFLCSFDSKSSGFELQKLAFDNGVKIFDLSQFILRPNPLLTKNNFVFGYAGIPESEIENAVARLEAAWKPQK